jgi:hypothetical protein
MSKTAPGTVAGQSPLLVAESSRSIDEGAPMGSGVSMARRRVTSRPPWPSFHGFHFVWKRGLGF